MALDSDDVITNGLNTKLELFAVNDTWSDYHCYISVLPLFLITILQDILIWTTLLHLCADHCLKVLLISLLGCYEKILILHSEEIKEQNNDHSAVTVLDSF
jgi:hypothetical protein